MARASRRQLVMRRPNNFTERRQIFNELAGFNVIAKTCCEGRPSHQPPRFTPDHDSTFEYKHRHARHLLVTTLLRGPMTWSRVATTFGVFYWGQVTNFDVFPFLLFAP